MNCPDCYTDHTRVLETVEAGVQVGNERIIASRLVGDLVAEKLHELDKVAYIRFVSAYKTFCEPRDFLRELDAV